MKENITGANNKKGFEERPSISNIGGSAAGINIGFQIEKFPKELKKNHFSSIDFTFFGILLFSFCLNISLVVFFKNMDSTEFDSKNITKIQKQYAKLLLESSHQSLISRPEKITNGSGLDLKMITSLTEWVENFDLNIFESLNNLSPEESGLLAEKNKTPLSYSKEELDALRKSNAEKRFSARSDLERQVESVGLLGLISGKDRDDNFEYVQDLLKYASQNSENLSVVLSKLNSIVVPRQGNNNYNKKSAGIFDYDKFANLKGERISADKEINDLVKNMASVNEVKTNKIARNIQYVDVKSSYLKKQQSSAIKNKRLANDVIRVVRSHMRSLQDCYKQELKNNPNLKGKIIVRFVISPDGVVNNSSMISSTLNNPRMENCILMRVKHWRNFSTCDSSFGNITYRQKFAFGK